MRNHFIAIALFSLLPFAAYCQEIKESKVDAEGRPYTIDNDSTTVYLAVDNPPEYPGGMEKLYKYVNENFKCLLKKSGHGKVYISFIVDKTGFIKKGSVKFIKDDGVASGCIKEVITNFEAMPQWRPGIQKDRPVAVKYTLPINY